MALTTNPATADPTTEEVTIEETQHQLLPEPTDTIPTSHTVILYNDDWHGFDEVIVQVQKAAGCTLEDATMIVLEAHFQGRAVCYRGDREQCHRVARTLREIRLQCEVDCD